jgi:AAA+ superfamily predicted ATPase
MDEKSNLISGLVTYKNQKEDDRSNAFEIQYPEDWDYTSLYGVERQKKALTRVISPFLKPNLSLKIRKILPRGAILYGPPGTGKTTLVRNIAKEHGIPLIIMRADKILNLYLGESEKRIAKVFDFVSDLKKCIIFIDDGEALFPRRDIQNSHHTFRTMEQVLFSEIDNMNPTKTQIFIATNNIDMLDPALISRASLLLDFETPDINSIISIFDEYLKEINHDESINLSKEIFAEKLKGKDGREITNIIGSAICNSIINANEHLKLEDILASLEERNIISSADVILIKDRIPKQDIYSSRVQIDKHLDYEKIVFDTQKKWNNFRNKFSFVTGKYGKILFLIKDIEDTNNFNDFYCAVKKSLKEDYSRQVLQRIIWKYKEMGLISYWPLKTNQSLHSAINYIENLSNDSTTALSIMEQKFKNLENKEDIVIIDNDLLCTDKKIYSTIDNYPPNTLLLTEEKPKYVGRKRNLGTEKFKKGTDERYYKNSNNNIFTEVKIQRLDASKCTIKLEDHDFLYSLYLQSKRILEKQEGPRSIFHGVVFKKLLESFENCEGLTSSEFYKFLMDKYKEKTFYSFKNNLLYLKKIDILKVEDGKFVILPRGKKLISIINNYGIDKVFESYGK